MHSSIQSTVTTAPAECTITTKFRSWYQCSTSFIKIFDFDIEVQIIRKPLCMIHIANRKLVNIERANSKLLRNFLILQSFCRKVHISFRKERLTSTFFYSKICLHRWVRAPIFGLCGYSRLLISFFFKTTSHTSFWS